MEKKKKFVCFAKKKNIYITEDFHPQFSIIFVVM